MDRRRREVIYTERMMVRLSPEEKVALQRAADMEHIPSLAVIARKAIIEWLEQRGLKIDKPGDLD